MMSKYTVEKTPVPANGQALTDRCDFGQSILFGRSTSSYILHFAFCSTNTFS